MAAIDAILEMVARRQPLTLLQQDIYLEWLMGQRDVVAKVKDLEEKAQRLDGVVGNIVPKAQTKVTKLSQIVADLGDVIAGRFIAPATAATSTEPTDTGFTGSFLSGDGETFDGTKYGVGGVSAGVLRWGGSNEDGRFVAGSGAVKLSEDGIEIPQGGDAILFSEASRMQYGNLSFRSYGDFLTSAMDMSSYWLENLTNQISNGDFETGDFTNWSETDPSNKMSVETVDNGYSLYVEDGTGSETIQQNLAATATRGMVVTMKVKASVVSAIQCGSPTKQEYVNVPAANEWRTFTFIIRESCAAVLVNPVSSNIYIDDIVVYPLNDTNASSPHQFIRVEPNRIIIDDWMIAALSGADSGTVIFNTWERDFDYEFHGENDTSLLKIDAGLDAIGMGGAAESGYKAKVTGSAKVTDGLHWGGWQTSVEAWTYASADDPVYQIYVAGDITADPNYKLGNKVWCQNNSTDFFGFIVKVGSYDAGNTRTPVDLYGGTDYDLANSAITAPYISKVKSPDGFPISPGKWTLTVTDTSFRSQASPTINVWYNLGSISINMPIGVWLGSYSVLVYGVNGSAGETICMTTLSTGSSTESDATSTRAWYARDILAGDYMLQIVNKLYSMTSKTTHYLNTKTARSGMTTIANDNGASTLEIKLVCAYL